MQIKYFYFFIFLFFNKNIIAQTPTTLDEYFKKENIAPKNIQEVFYEITKQGNGATPKRGDYVKVKYVGKLLDGTVFDKSEPDGLVFQLGYRQVIQGWEIGVPMLKVGSKGGLFVPSKLAYGSRALEKIPANADLIFEIEIVQILTESEYERYNAEMEQKEKMAFEKAKKVQKEKDEAIIQAYIATKKLKTSKTNSGLHYIVTKKGKGENVKSGDLITVEYEGTLTDDSIFDSTKEKKEFQFVSGAKKVMEGWEEGFRYFNKGSEGFLIIPSHLAYKGTAIVEKKIPPYAVLVFKVKVKNIQKK
jgi:FKBP-type peptidyl-prolyl cis-trans isomerase FkpA